VTAVRRALDAEDDPEPTDEPGEAEAPDEAEAPREAEPAAGPGPGTAAGPDPGSAPPSIALENSAGGGFGLGVDLDELTAIADALGVAGVPAERIGFCLDTAHAWGAGLDLSDPDAIDRFVDDFDRRIGLERLKLIHLNDSRSERGSRTDRHEHLGAGRIGEIGLGHLLRQPRLAGATWILETPGMDEGYDALNLGRALALARGEALAPLPPEAFTLRSTRTRVATPVDPPIDPPVEDSAPPAAASSST
jgi:hypothetical protein